MWKLIDGWKTYGGIAIAVLGVVICILKAWPVSPAEVATCLESLLSPETLTGAGIGIAALGAAHKVEKSAAKDN